MFADIHKFVRRLLALPPAPPPVRSKPRAGSAAPRVGPRPGAARNAAPGAPGLTVVKRQPPRRVAAGVPAAAAAAEAVKAEAARETLQSSPSDLPEVVRKILEPCKEFTLLAPDGALFVARDQAGHPSVRSFEYSARRFGARVHITAIDFEELAALQEHSEKHRGVIDVVNVRRAIRLLTQARDAGANDVHIQVFSKWATVQFRVNNSLWNFEQWPAAEAETLCRSLFQGLASVTDVSYNPEEFQDGQISSRTMLPSGVESVRLVRGPMLGGQFVVSRLLYGRTHEERGERKAEPVKLAAPRAPRGENGLPRLGFSPQQQAVLARMMGLPSGMNIISGPTGSGKSTTLKVALEQIMREQPDLRVVTIEDPPEYRIEGAIQLPVKDARTEEDKALAFAERVRVALRMDPDIIMIGEVRGAATANAAIDAALTGHQVWATVHTVDAFSIITRFVRLGINPDEVADAYVMTGMIAQRLVKLLCAHCKLPLAGNEDKLSPRLLAALRARSPSGTLQGVCLQGSGCQRCEGRGVCGRAVVAEVIAPDQKLLDLVRKEGVAAARERYYADPRRLDMLSHGLKRVFAGEVDPRGLQEVVGIVKVIGEQEDEEKE